MDLLRKIIVEADPMVIIGKKEQRHVRQIRSRNATSICNKERVLPQKISTSTSTSTSTGLPFYYASSMLSLLIVALIAVEKIPLTSLAFQNHHHHHNIINIINNNSFNKRIQRILITTDWKEGTIARYCNRHCPLDYPSKFKNTRLYIGNDDKNDGDDDDDDSNILDDRILFDDIDDDLDDKEFLKRQLAHLESMEKMLEDIDEYCGIEGMCEDDDDDDEDDDDDDEMIFMGDDDDLEDMESLFDFLEEEFGDDDDDENFVEEEEDPNEIFSASTTTPAVAANSRSSDAASTFSPQGLEEALLQGVVPIEAVVGGNTLPGDFGFDPFGFAEKDYVQDFQYRFLDALPGGNPDRDPPPAPRPSALVLRDYREAEIRHGRLAMLAVVIWPIQEKLDQLLLEPNQCGPILYGPITLPYFPLFMTLLIMLLGYLDIYAKDIQEEEGVGDAFLPGDCFWDPLKVLDGAPSTMKRNMQERELFNGRVAMLAFAAFVFEEGTSHEAIVDIPGNEVLFVPAYQIPSVQAWLDGQFLTYDTI
jgi:light-harvesting complex I chlorophyll a/b binding protein 1